MSVFLWIQVLKYMGYKCYNYNINRYNFKMLSNSNCAATDISPRSINVSEITRVLNSQLGRGFHSCKYRAFQFISHYLQCRGDLNVQQLFDCWKVAPALTNRSDIRELAFELNLAPPSLLHEDLHALSQRYVSSSDFP